MSDPWQGRGVARVKFNYLTWEAQAREAARVALERRDYVTAAREAANAARHAQALVAIRECAEEAKRDH